MKYELIQPPYHFQFGKLTDNQLKHFYEWYMHVREERIDELTAIVKSTSGYENWLATYSPSSLDELGHWFVASASFRLRSLREMDEISETLEFQVPISDKGLSDRTISYAFDLSIYLGEVLVRNNPALCWSQRFDLYRKRRMEYYGQPVVVDFECGPLNVLRITSTLAYGIIKGNLDGSRLRSAYDIWSSKAVR